MGKDYPDCPLELYNEPASSSFCLFCAFFRASALIFFIILLGTSYPERRRFCIL